ncbi:MAG: glutamine--fructose-6-phosphate transaminase (isomerizing) [Chloroflexi bacterium]|nr:glutamine--fructose-6-phosphate transaminase (isomerizing) [Chloroflexota bacterium]
MCGIVAYTGSADATPILLKGLKSLEYRGYDSAGVAIQTALGTMEVLKTAGRVEELDALVAESDITGHTGIGHTRWATHGVVNRQNSHPHVSCDGEVALVHNGIVENYLELRTELAADGHTLLSDTDTEAIVHLIEMNMRAGQSLEDALLRAAGRLKGAGTFVVSARNEPGKIVGMRTGNAGGIVVGHIDDGNMMASDLLAVLPYTNKVVYLDSGEQAIITNASVIYRNGDGDVIDKEIIISDRSAESAELGAFPHFMLKEIHEQAERVASAMRGRVDFETGSLNLPEIPFTDEQIRNFDQVVLVGMGTSLHSAMMGATLIESFARIPAKAENASEFRYKNPVLNENTLVISVTQSGETADTLAAMEGAAAQNAKQLAVVEIDGSQATRMADGSLLVRAGLEVAVASTKTMTNTVVCLYMLAIHLASIRGTMSQEARKAAVSDLASLPGGIGSLISQEQTYKAIAERLVTRHHLLYLGRGFMFPAAMEGALKMKEIAYIHAEGYAAGEMKHGVNALISEDMPTIALAPAGPLHEKMVSNLNEVKARGGQVIAIVTEGDEIVPSIVDEVIELPAASEALSAIFSLVPMQLLAYYTAVALKQDPDKPRNLAKTVTVE